MDISLFFKAASDMLAALPTKSEHKITKPRRNVSYGELKKFQKYRTQLDNCCYQLFQIIQDCTNRGFLPHTLIEELGKVSQKIQSQRFRLAVLGEFSQGKSTLLNALLGEEIQPVREIPCSGMVTVLKYGIEKRVICRYKDGREEEIPFEQYQLKATISEDAALGCLSDELVDDEIDEIVFEHPDLELCSSGVEIVDSPGLNEHPNRTAITQKLLKDTDAVIFITNASRSLTQVERDLLQDVRTQLNHGQENEPATNLFIVGNFIDLVRTEKGRELVQRRIETIVQGQNPIVAGENRVHFISAQAALDAILRGTEDDYLKAFQNFTQSLEKFLTLDSGRVKIKHSISQINRVIEKGLDGLYQSVDTLDGKIKIYQVEKYKLLEQIGEASGYDIKIRYVAKMLNKEASVPAKNACDKWRKILNICMAEKSKKWVSQHSPVFNQKNLIQDYVNQFTIDLSQEIDDQINNTLTSFILKEYIDKLDFEITIRLKVIQAKFNRVEQQIPTHWSDPLDLAISGINDNFIERAFLGGIGIGGTIAAGLIVFTGLGLVPVVLAGLATGMVGEIGSGMIGFDGIKDQIKRKVCEIGLQNLDKLKIDKKLDDVVGSVFEKRVESSSRVIAQAIALYENLLEQQEKAHNETLEQREAEKIWIYQKRQELEQVQNRLEVILSKCAIV
ncbi:dynamin family protein [Nostoc sp.]|uniref:dynamin family protein n=1 Tax=Nostoc sp. TaxID=1180 RepID=UPI002FF7E9A3